MSCRIVPIAFVVLSVGLVACAGESGQPPAADPPALTPAAAAAAEAMGVGTPQVSPSGRTFQTTLDDFPGWVPLPAEYVVIMDAGMGSIRSTALETGGDVRDVVAYLNAQLSASAGATIEQVESMHDRYFAQGVIMNGTASALIQVSEYDEGGALKPGNTTSVTYRVGG